MGSLFPGLALEAWMTVGPCVLPVNAKGPAGVGAPVTTAEYKQSRPLVL